MIKISINLSYVEGTSEKQLCILRSQIIRSISYTENTLHKRLCKPKVRVGTKDKNKIAYEIDCSKCKTVYFGESKRPLKLHLDEHERSVRDCDCEKNEIAKQFFEVNDNFSWDQKKTVNSESRLTPRKNKETIHCKRNPNHKKFPICFLKYAFLSSGSSY